ncbi:integrase core domain-containing protein [Pseudomonas poae]|nr:integrase core domain-containing protein [Pseudomonas poae]
MNQRIKLVADWLSGNFTKSQLARRFGVSRPTVDKWISRYNGDLKSLAELSRRPHNSPSKTDDEILAQIAAMKEAHSSWGPKKLIKLLQNADSSIAWPSPSTAGQWLDRLGLVNKRRFKRRHGTSNVEMREANEPNKTWCADYKGQFKMLNAQMCFPLTVTDHASRFILASRAHPKIKTQPVKQAFERLFLEYGMPEVIRSDNGVPFASPGLARMSTLAVWWIRLGIYPERIMPGRPAQNGRHERMHRSLKRELPLGSNLVEQQLLLEHFRHEFNYVRPHEALGMKCPGHVYVPSTRVYPGSLPDVEYPTEMQSRSVRTDGSIKWNGKLVFVSEALSGERIGLKEVEDDVWDLYLCDYPLGRLGRGMTRVQASNV